MPFSIFLGVSSYLILTHAVFISTILRIYVPSTIFENLAVHFQRLHLLHRSLTLTAYYNGFSDACYHYNF